MMMPVTPVWLEKIQYTPLNFFCDGWGAVILFFVLSGLVLNLKYVALETLPPRWVPAFLINRVFRIYPAFFVAILLSLFFRFFLYDPSVMGAMSADLNSHWRDPLNVPELLKLFTLVAPGIHPAQIDPPMWTLVYEMRISLFFPLVIFCLSRRWKMMNDLVFLAVIYLVCLVPDGPTIHCVPFFVLGAVCAKHLGRIRSVLGKFNPGLQVLWLGASMVLLETVAMATPYPLAGRYASYLCQQLVGLGAAGIILGCVSFTNVAALLSTSPFQFIGRTSYSFYLVHMLFQLTPAPLIYHWTGSWMTTWLAALILTYFVAWLMFRYVEKPMIKQGHALAARFSKSPSASPKIPAN
jgi:peptidoglycan/LPS O-acetylase OafA/YrhL